MDTNMNHLLLILIIISSTVAGLIGIAGAIATVRALIGRATEKWNVSDVQIAEQRAANEGWPHRMAVALDIAVNVIVLRGQQDETISTHSYRASIEGKMWGKCMTVWLGWIQPNHGQKAASGDLERAKSRVTILSKLLGA